MIVVEAEFYAGRSACLTITAKRFFLLSSFLVRLFLILKPSDVYIRFLHLSFSTPQKLNGDRTVLLRVLHYSVLRSLHASG